MVVFAPLFPAPSSLTLHFWVLHEQQEAIAQGGADSLCAREEEVQGGQHQVLHVELSVGVFLLLWGEGGSGVPTPFWALPWQRLS